MKMLARLALVASLAFGANVASAIPLTVNVSTAALGGSTGSWTLQGATDATRSWTHVFLGSNTWSLDILAGDYDWNIQGIGLGVGLVHWNVAVNNVTVISGNDSGFGRWRIRDSGEFSATSVPEPATLGLLGLGIAGLGLVRRRKA